MRLKELIAALEDHSDDEDMSEDDPQVYVIDADGKTYRVTRVGVPNDVTVSIEVEYEKLD